MRNQESEDKVKKPTVQQWILLLVSWMFLPLFVMLLQSMNPNFRLSGWKSRGGPAVFICIAAVFSVDMFLRHLIHRYPEQSVWRALWGRRAYLMLAAFIVLMIFYNLLAQYLGDLGVVRI